MKWQQHFFPFLVRYIYRSQGYRLWKGKGELFRLMEMFTCWLQWGLWVIFIKTHCTIVTLIMHMFISCSCISLLVLLKQQKIILSWFRRLGVWNQGVNKTLLPLRKDPFLLLPVSGFPWFLGWGSTTLSCLCLHMAFSSLCLPTFLSS